MILNLYVWICRANIQHHIRDWQYLNHDKSSVQWGIRYDKQALFFKWRNIK